VKELRVGCQRETLPDTDKAEKGFMMNGVRSESRCRQMISMIKIIGNIVKYFIPYHRMFKLTNFMANGNFLARNLCHIY
jgi:hypothetical protein